MITVIPTIDVEGVHGRFPFEQMVLGEVGDSETWGVYRIARIFNKYRVSGTFFVDCYEYTLWGEEPLKRVCNDLLEMGQDVQLHTHPSWRDDYRDSASLRAIKKNKSYFPQSYDLMAKLSEESQLEVLEHGIELFQKWLGIKPVAHRSGGYSINEETVNALTKAGIPMDSSMNIAHPNSKVTWSANRVVLKSGILELPITVMKYTFQVPITILNLTLYSKLMKTDLDTFTLEELLWFVEQADAMGLKIMNIFMHSYSLLKCDTFFKKIQPNPYNLHKLDSLLRTLSENPKIRFLNCASFLNYYRNSSKDFEGPDGIPEKNAIRQITSFVVRKAKNHIIKLTQRPDV